MNLKEFLEYLSLYKKYFFKIMFERIKVGSTLDFMRGFVPKRFD